MAEAISDSAEAIGERGSALLSQSSDDANAFFAALEERERKLDEREAAVAAKEGRVAEAEQLVRAQLATLDEAESRLTALVEVAATAAENDVAKLVTTFQAMEEKKAAAIFETMDVRFAAGLLARMNDEPAAKILEALTPDKAYAVTAFIAGRNAKAPKE